MQKMEKTKSKSAKSKTQKQNKREKQGEKKERQKGENMGKNGLVHLHFLCFYLCVFFCFLPGKKQNKSKQIEKAKIMQQKCKWTSPFFSIFSPFLALLFFPFILLPVFFGFEVVLFDFPCVFLFCFFFKFKKH